MENNISPRKKTRSIRFALVAILLLLLFTCTAWLAINTYSLSQRVNLQAEAIAKIQSELEPSETAVEPQKEVDKGDISKVVISGQATTKERVHYGIACTVTNNDTVEHNIELQIIYFGKDKSPILTEESGTIRLKPGGIESAEFDRYINAQLIESHEIKIVDKDDPDSDSYWDAVRRANGLK